MFPRYVGVNIYSVFCTSVMKCHCSFVCNVYELHVVCPIDFEGLS